MACSVRYRSVRVRRDLACLAGLILAAPLLLAQQCVLGSRGSIAIPPPDVDPQPRVTLVTSAGNIVLELFPQQAPLTVEHFLQYAHDGFYNGTIIHAVIRNTALVGGTFTEDLQRKTTRDPIANESNSGLTNRRGTIAMSIRDDGLSGAEFMINLDDNPSADFDLATGTRGATVFGKVVQGMNLLDLFGQLSTETQTAQDGTRLPNLPSNPPVILDVLIDVPPPSMEENLAPVVSAGQDHNVAPRVTVTLDGAAADGNIGDRLTYRWEQTAGPAVQLSSTTTLRPTFVAPEGPADLSFTLTATDTVGATSMDTVNLHIVGGTPYVRLSTTMGDIVFEMLVDGAPITTLNFLQYVEDGFYNGTIFHRVVNDPEPFVIQGGGFLPDLSPQQGLRDAIQNEFSPDRSNVAGTVAMAKRGDSPNSATSQFFVNLSDNSENLDNQNGGFTVFARVVEGMDVVYAIAEVPVSAQQTPDGNTFNDVPVTPVIINSATVESFE
jgi:cyclophilin family peptidyl-prolyl cis-trans isomerase